MVHTHTTQADVTRAMGTENTLEGKTIQNLIIQCMAMPGAYLCGGGDCKIVMLMIPTPPRPTNHMYRIDRLTIPGMSTQTQTYTGYILAVIFLDRIGRKNLQMIGFAGEALVFMLMAIFHQQFKGLPALFVIM